MPLPNSILPEHTGKRILWRRRYGPSISIVESTVLEFSPTGDYVKVMFENKNKDWFKVEETIVIEVLGVPQEQ